MPFVIPGCTARLAAGALTCVSCTPILPLSAAIEHVTLAQVLLPALRDDMARLPPPDDVSPAACASLPSGAPPQTPAAASPAEPPGQCAAELDDDWAKSAAEHADRPSGGLPAGRRRYLTCCVRLSPEKEPHRFVELVEVLSRCVECTCVRPVLKRERARPPRGTVSDHQWSATADSTGSRAELHLLRSHIALWRQQVGQALCV